MIRFMQLSSLPIKAIPSVGPSTFAEEAFARIRADILSVKLQPEEKMHVERLKEIYGVGATPIREALSKLSSIDLVVAEGQRGFRVAPVSVANLLDITKTRAWIDAVALRASIANGDRHWESQIVAAVHRMEGCAIKENDALTEQWYQENRAFHDALVAGCYSPQIMAFRSQLYDLSERYRRLSVHEGLGGRDLDAEHRQILDAVLARNADEAIHHIEEHFIETTLTILKGQTDLPDSADNIIKKLRCDIRSGSPHS